MNDFEYLLSTIDKIKGVGKKTLSSFNKKKYLQYLISCGICLLQRLKQQKIQKL